MRRLKESTSEIEERRDADDAERDQHEIGDDAAEHGFIARCPGRSCT